MKIKNLISNGTKWFKKYFIPHLGNEHQPHFLRHESMFALFMLVIIIELGFLVQVFVVFDKTKFLSAVLPGVLETLANEEREDLNVPPLKENPLLMQAAQMKAEDMAKNSYFAHTSPTGITPWYWFDQVGYRYVHAGENLAVNFSESSDVGKAWMNSPTHKANIIKKDYTEIGIGVASGVYQGRNTVFVAQLFGTPAVAFQPSVPEAINPVVPATIQPNTTPSVNPTVKPTPKPTTSPTPSPSPAPTTPTTVTSAIPENTIVLGEESNSNNAFVARLSREASVIKSFIQRMLTSPREYVNYIYGLMAGIVFMVLLLVVFIRSEIRHPEVMYRGVGLMAVIALLFIFNLSILGSNTQITTEALSASVVAY